MTDVAYFPVCALADVPIGIGVPALVAGTQIALFRVAKDPNMVFAISNYDPFSEAYVLSRGITGELAGKVVVASPMYKQHFDLTTGECLEDATVRINTYPVSIVAEHVHVHVSQ